MNAPWLCRLDVHTRTYSDGAMYSSAARCSKCGNWVDPSLGAEVERERGLWAKYDDASSVAIAFARGES